MSNQENAVDAARNFCKVVFLYVEKMPKGRKFTVGDRLVTLSISLLEQITDAYYSPRSEKAFKIKRANNQCETIRQIFRLQFESDAHDLRKHEHISRELDKLGSLLGGWVKSISAA